MSADTAMVGCFGSVLLHLPEERRCKLCPLAERCAAEVDGNRQKLQRFVESEGGKWSRKRRLKNQLVGLEPRQKPITPEEVTPAAEKTEPTPPAAITRLQLNKKPGELLRRWLKQGVDLQAMLRGANPFANGGSTFARVGIDWMLTVCRYTPFTKRELVGHFEASLGWACGTANSHAGILIDILMHEHLIRQEGGYFFVRRNT